MSHFPRLANLLEMASRLTADSGISAGWSWTYGATRSGLNRITHNNISGIGYDGVLCDLACVYHLGQDNGTLIDSNLCFNVSSHGVR